jgi:sugar phosphate isomerase/epimerase
MGREFSLAHFTLIDCPPPAFAVIAARAGYDYVGLRIIPFDRPGEPRYLLGEDRTLFRETKQALADTGIRLLDIELAQISDQLNPRVYLPALEAGACLGAAYLLTTVWTTDRSRVIDTFGALCDLAAPLGLAVVLEFVSFADLATLDGAVDIVNSSGRGNAGILLDTLHCHLAATSLEDIAALPHRWLPYVHVCDAPPEIPATRDERRQLAREGRLLPGEGVIDVAGIVGRLPQTTIVAVEVPNPQRARTMGAQEYATRSLLAAKRCVSPVSPSGASP